MTLDPPDATSDQAGVPLLDEDYLILSTAVTTATRWDGLPDIPTVGDFVPGYEASNWYGLCAYSWERSIPGPRP